MQRNPSSPKQDGTSLASQTDAPSAQRKPHMLQDDRARVKHAQAEDERHAGRDSREQINSCPTKSASTQSHMPVHASFRTECKCATQQADGPRTASDD